MFARVAAVLSLTLAVLAVPTEHESESECTTGSIQCCNSVESANSAAASALLALLGVVVQDTTTQLGFECSPVNFIGVGNGNACAAQPVCCENENIGGLVSVGCVPVML